MDSVVNGCYVEVSSLDINFTVTLEAFGTVRLVGADNTYGASRIYDVISVLYL